MTDRRMDHWLPPLWLENPMLPEEPPHGIYMRLADRNGVMRITEFENMTGLKLRHVRLGRDLDRLAAMLRCRVDDISKNSITHVKGGLSVIAGQHVQRMGDLMMRNRRACPACLSASLHHRYWWDVEFITSCPDHGLPLIEQCECGNKLTWNDANIVTCHVCGIGDIRRLRPKNAFSNVVHLDRWILSRFRTRSDARAAPIIDELPLGRAIELIERVGALSEGGYNTRWQEITDFSAPSPTVRASGFRILSTGGLDALLDRIYESYIASDSSAFPSLKTMYGWFWHWFAQRGYDGFSSKLAELIYTNAAAKIQISRRALRRVERASDTITLVEAADMFGRTSSSTRTLLLAEGLISPATRKGSPVRVELADAQRIAADLADSVNLVDVGHIIGIGRVGVFRLAASDRLPIWIRGGGDTMHRYILRRKELQSWLKNLIGNPPIANDLARELVSLAEAPRRTHLSVNLLVDALASGAIQVVTVTERKPNFATAYVNISDVRQHMANLGPSACVDPLSKYRKRTKGRPA